MPQGSALRSAEVMMDDLNELFEAGSCCLILNLASCESLQLAKFRQGTCKVWRELDEKMGKIVELLLRTVQWVGHLAVGGF